MLEEPLRHLTIFNTGEPRVALADIAQPVPTPHGKRIVAEHADTLAVSVFDGGHNHVERGQFAFELQPRLAATAGSVAPLEVLDHQAFVAASAGCDKELLDVFRGICLRNRSAKNGRRGRLLTFKAKYALG